MTALFRWSLFLVLLGAAAAWWLTRPERLDPEIFAGLEGDAAKGAEVFHAAGCASCHIAPDAKEGDGPPVLSGGRAFATAFGTFHAPNISPDPEHGIGNWTDLQIADAVMRGVSPEGHHLYPVFPYAAYGKAAPQDILSLIAYLRGLPASSEASQPQQVSFPFNIRRGLGLWKRLFIHQGWAVPGDLPDPAARGRYLAEALAHCGQCHTPRNALGGPLLDRWLGGAPNPSGKGRIPDITPGALKWSEADIAYYLGSGFTPDFDTAGGDMALVVKNLAQLPEADRTALAAYLKVVPPVPPEAGASPGDASAAAAGG